ncbi:Extracellular metalloprotease [Escovopsis weberi]|uniref:Extracellular metalloprotease n=1 Tax=Escovopsis weberi TaxID=150374 RepID=A0A0M8N7H6_ESCWE|nr:Extracellular metalloprotease [Escovopsis weberi]
MGAMGAMMPHYDVVDVVEDAPKMCGFEPTPEDYALMRQVVEEERQEDLVMHRRRFEPSSVININTFFHIVVESEAVKHALTDDTMRLQLDIMNKDYARAGFSFTLVAITRTVNRKWVREIQIVNMRRALHAGSWRDLNLYFIPTFPLFGVCSLPSRPADFDPGRLDLDGCIIRADTVPGGDLPNFNMGRTAVHEVGHWLGLFHTFEGGCDGNGDFVDDTPAQKNATGGCPQSRDSCPHRPGVDPIHNFMDYSHDWCYSEFTPGQIRRMHDVWKKFRSAL